MIISECVDLESEKTGILNLTRKAYGDSEIALPSYYNWLYRENPQGNAIILLAKDEEKNNLIIGIEPIIPMKIIIDQNVFLSYLSCNSVVDPEYRRQGIFSKLVSSTLSSLNNNEISCIYGVPNEKSHNAFIRHGFTDVTRLPLLVRPLKFSKYFSEPIRTLLCSFDSIWKIRTRCVSNIELFTGKYGSDFDILTDKASKKVSVMQKRDKDFLQWRYANHPSRKYKTFVLKEGTILRGYIITRQTTINEKTAGVIVDFMVDPEINSHEKFKDLVNVALEDFWKSNIPLAIATCGCGLLETKILRKTGFYTIPNFLKPVPLHLIVKSFNSSFSNLSKLKKFDNWFFSFGDYDVF